MKEIMYALESIQDPNVMENFIKQQDANGCSSLVNTLRYAKVETETHWQMCIANCLNISSVQIKGSELIRSF